MKKAYITTFDGLTLDSEAEVNVTVLSKDGRKPEFVDLLVTRKGGKIANAQMDEAEARKLARALVSAFKVDYSKPGAAHDGGVSSEFLTELDDA